MMKLYKIFFLMMVLIHMGVLTGSQLWAQEVKLDWKPFEDAVEIAEKDQKPIMVDVMAPWCGWCKKMRKEVYPKLSDKLGQDFVLTSLNRDDNESEKNYQGLDMTPFRLAKMLNVQNVPAVIFLSAEGEYLFHIAGFVEAEKLEPILDYALSIYTVHKSESGPN